MKKILLVAALASLCTLSGPSRAATEEATLTFVAPDGVRLEGVVVYPGAESDWAAPYPLAILVHHHGRNRDSLIPLADALAARGIASLVMDQRGHGRSRTLEDRQALYVFPVLPESHIRRGTYDQAQALHELRDDPRLDLDRVAIVGVGIGALVAAEASWRAVDATDALVLVDPSAELAGFRPTRDIGLFGERPVLFVCSALARSKAMSQRLSGFGSGPRDVRCVDDFEVTDRLLQSGLASVGIVVSWLGEVLGAEKR